MLFCLIFLFFFLCRKSEQPCIWGRARVSRLLLSYWASLWYIWDVALFIYQSVVLISIREGIVKSSVHFSSGSWNCGSWCFIQEVTYKRMDKCFLYLFPSPIPSFSLLCSLLATYPVCFAARGNLPVAWCQWVMNKIKTFKCVCKYTWRLATAVLSVIYTGAHEIWSG